LLERVLKTVVFFKNSRRLESGITEFVKSI